VISVKNLNSLSKLFYLLTYRFRRARIQVNQAILSGNNNFIDIRYWLSRPDKFKSSSPIYLVDESSGQRLGLMRITKIGSIRTKHHKHQSMGILLFYNRNKIISHGSQVTLHFGYFDVKNIKVM
jgi:hypothetical protein